MSYKMINCLRMKFFKTGIFIAFIMCWAATAWGQQTVLQGGVYFATTDNPLPGVSVMLVNRNGLVLSGVSTNEHRPEARGGGKECASTCRSRWSRYDYTKNTANQEAD